MTPPTRPQSPLDDAAAQVWAELERLQGFSERVAKGRAQLAAGQRIPLDPDPLRPDDDRIPRHERRERRRAGCSIFVLAVVVLWRLGR